MNNKLCLCVIDAMNTSNSLKHVLHRTVLDKPLIIWSMELSLSIKFFKQIMVLSDDKQIIQWADDFNLSCPFKYEHKKSNHFDIAQIAYQHLKHTLIDYILILSPFYPMVNTYVLEHAFEKMLASKAHGLFSTQKLPYNIKSLYTDKAQSIIDNTTEDMVVKEEAFSFFSSTFLQTDAGKAKSLIPFPLDQVAGLKIRTEIDLLIIEHLLKIKNQ